MKHTSKIFNLFLSVILVFFSISPISGRVFGDSSEQPSLTLTSAGQPVAVVSVPQQSAVSVVEVSQPAVSTSSTTEFLVEDNPLSPAEQQTERTERTTDRSDDEIVSIESNDPFYSTSRSWGQSYDDLWWLKRVRADQAWTYSTGVGSTVAVIDTGVDYNHEDMTGKIWTNAAEASGLPGVDDDGNGFIDDIHGWDYVNNDNDPRDDNDHGTMVAGIIGASTNNGLGIASIAPNSQIIPIKVLNAQGSGFVSHVISAIRYAADLAADVINLSLGVFKNLLSKYWQNAFQSAVAYAKSKGSIVVAAAGNDGGRVENDYPAGIPDVIAVGATEPVTDNRAYFSNFGKLLDFVAPGVDILSLNAAGGQNFGGGTGNPNYTRASGTSFSSPIVAGIVALLRGQNQAFTYNQIYGFLKQSTVDLGTAGFDYYYGWGLVDAFGALALGAQAVSLTAKSSVTTSSSGGAILGEKSSRSSSRFADLLPQPQPFPYSGFVLPLTSYEWRLASSQNDEESDKQTEAKRRNKKKLLSQKRFGAVTP